MAAEKPDDDLLRVLYERMVLIREVEEGLRREYASRNIRGPIHLSIGQEAVAVGVLSASRPDDVCISTHRNHAHYLAKGGNLGAMIDELYGLTSGCSGGAGGSMHLFDNAVGMWGSSAIVGGSVPIAVGLGLGKRLGGTKDVAIAFSGDGGTDEGSFWESLNLASLLMLPVLFVVEQNELSTNTFMDDRHARRDIVAKAHAFGVDAEALDGNDAADIHAVASRSLAVIRASSRPRLIELRTSRLCAHVGPSVSVDSAAGPYPDWAERVAREPLRTFHARVEMNAPALLPELDAIAATVRARVARAFESAKRSFAERNAILKLEAPPPPNPSRV